MQIYKQADKVRVGPFTVEQIRAMISSRTMTGDDLIWHEGLTAPVKVSDSELFSTDAMMAAFEDAGRAVGVELQNAAKRNVYQAALSTLVGYLITIGLSYLLCEWLRGRLQPNQVAGWCRGAVYGGIAWVHLLQGMLGHPKPVYWGGPTSWGYAGFFWVFSITTPLSLLTSFVRFLRPARS